MRAAARNVEPQPAAHLIDRRRVAETLLITGGAGFIGSHLAEGALRDGHRVVVIDNLSTGKRENVPPGAELVERDLRDEGLEELMRELGVTVVSHHAAQANVRVSVEQPMLDAEANVLGSLKLIQACRHTGVRRFLFASSGGTVYGEQERSPATRTTRRGHCRPTAAASSRSALPARLRSAGRPRADHRPLRQHLRGPAGPQGRGGDHRHLRRELLRGEPTRIFGDGLQTRDYVHVSDVVAVSRAALSSGSPGSSTSAPASRRRFARSTRACRRGSA